MRILCLTARLPFPPDRGDRLRAYHILGRLSAEHELELFSFVSNANERRHLPQLQKICTHIHTVTLSRRRSLLAALANSWRSLPLQALYFRSRRMASAIDERLRSAPFDAAYVHLFRMAPYLAPHPEIYRVLDFTDVISLEIARAQPYRTPWWRLVYRLEGPRIASYEQAMAMHFDESWVISEAERCALARRCPGATIQVVPNGVDMDAFRPAKPASEAAAQILFVGHLRVPHNVDAARFLATEILPLVRRRLPRIRLVLAGADPAPAVRRLTADPAVEVPGFVPDLNELLQRSTVFVAPLRFAAGVQNKVLEAMAAARPVITTELVNEGLGARPDLELVEAEGAHATADAVVRLVADPELRRQLGRNARRFVAARYSWELAAKRMRHIQNTLHS